MSTTNISKAQSSGSATNKFTLSFWAKRSVNTAGRLFTATGSSGDVYFRFNGNSTMEWSGDASNASSAGYFVTNRLFRDYSNWYNLVIRFDSTQGSASNRLRFYVNGVQEESFSSYTDVNSGAVDKINLSGNTHYIGGAVSSQYFHGLLSHVHYCDGYSYGADSFGSTDATTGEWKLTPQPSVTYGSNGYFILKDGATLTDSSSNSNNFAVANGTLTATEDCPSNVFATMNPLNTQADGYTITNGNNSITGNASNAWRSLYGTLGASTGKFYWEQKINNNTDSSHIIGISDIDKMKNINDNDFENASTSAYGYRPDGAKISKNTLSAGYGNTYTTNDIIGVAVDLDNSKIYFSKNGTWQNSGDPTSGATGTGAAYTIDANTTYTATTSTNQGNNYYSYNFGNGVFGATAISSEGSNASGIGKFEYDVPAGFTALSTKGLNE